MTVDEIVAVVCECLDEIGITPGNGGECEEWSPQELALPDETIVQLFTCIKKKMSESNCTAVLGKTMWKKSKTVRHFCQAVHKTQSCE